LSLIPGKFNCCPVAWEQRFNFGEQKFSILYLGEQKISTRECNGNRKLSLIPGKFNRCPVVGEQKDFQVFAELLKVQF
jgi:hypothetical protein